MNTSAANKKDCTSDWNPRKRVNPSISSVSCQDTLRLVGLLNAKVQICEWYLIFYDRQRLDATATIFHCAAVPYADQDWLVVVDAQACGSFLMRLGHQNFWSSYQLGISRVGLRE